MNKIGTVILSVILTLIFAAGIFFGCVPMGRAMWNQYNYTLHKVDDHTLYETRKQVEDTCRTMQSSYKSDCMTYEQYNGTDSAEKQGWADQAKMRANKTAATYNEYVLKNSYVWDGNVPSDISSELPYID